MSTTLLPWILAVPAMGAVLVACTGRWPNVREAMTLGTAVVLFLLVNLSWPADFAPEDHFVLADPLPGISLALHVEPLGILFALVASFLWIVTSVYAIGYMRGHKEKNQTRFYVAFAVAISATMGVAFAANLFTLFVFYEVLTISTYPLVVHAGTDEARRAGRVYLGILLGTSVCLQLPAIVCVWYFAGDLDFQVGGLLADKLDSGMGGILLLLFAFGIGKAALMPFHRWLPAAMVAPTPVSALLHAVAVVKAGVFAVLKITVYVFGIDYLANVAMTDIVLYVAIATIVLASLVALRQDNLKKRLAYSTISQLGYIVLGAMLATSAGVVGGAMHIATHAFGKITLFFAAGAIMVAAHKTEISEMRGLGRSMPLTFGFFLVGALSIIGLPPMAGTWSKWYLVMGSLDAGQWVAVVALLASSLLNIAYLLPIPFHAFFSPGANRDTNPRIQEAPWPCLLAMAITSMGCILMFFAPNTLHGLAQAVVN